MKCPALVDPWMCWACGTSGTYPSPWMTTLSPPLSVAVNVAVPVTPLSLASSSWAVTVVSAVAGAAVTSSRPASASTRAENRFDTGTHSSGQAPVNWA